MPAQSENQPTRDAASAIELERIALYLRQRPTLRFGNFALQLVCAALLLPTQSPVLLAIWIALNVVLMQMRNRATRRVESGEIDSAAAAKQWFRSLTFAVFLGGSVWGGGVFVFLDISDPVRLSILLLILMGVSWGAVASLSMHFPAVVAFISPLCGLTALKLASFGTNTAVMLALLTLAFMAFTLVTARNYAASIDATFRLGVENLRLLGEVTAARDAAERASTEKSRFLAALSHDVRQPLYAAGLFLESLGARLTNAEQRGVYDNASTALNSVDELLSAVLEISQLENAPPHPAALTFDLATVAAGLRAEFSAEATAKGLVLRFHEQREVLLSDPVLVARVLRNLISNALKHTSDGHIELRVEDAGERVRISVADTGDGIAADDHERIFDEYYQLNNPGRDHRRGLGLGLAVVRRLCVLLDTHIELVSAPGEGACFSFTVPRGDARDLPLPDADSIHDLVGIHVLFVEDDDAVRAGLALMLGDWHCHVSAGASLESAVECASGHPRPIDIVLSDYRLAKGITGVDVIREVRQRFDPALPALLITGESHGIVAGEAAAVDVPVLRKPVAPAHLHEAIGRAIA